MTTRITLRSLSLAVVTTVLLATVPMAATAAPPVVRVDEKDVGVTIGKLHNPGLDYVLGRLTCGTCEDTEVRPTFIDGVLRSAQGLATRQSAPDLAVPPAPR